jgi:hypothetical protein
MLHVDKQMDAMKLVIAFPNFVNVPKKRTGKAGTQKHNKERRSLSTLQLHGRVSRM